MTVDTATGASVYAAWQEEQRRLAPLPPLPEPSDLAVTRTVAHDCTVAFEARRYSVPFAHPGRTVMIHGCSRVVQVWADGRVVAEHPRHGRERIVIDPRHYEGEATRDMLPPLPLGRMGQRLQAIATLAPQQRPIDLYAAPPHRFLDRMLEQELRARDERRVRTSLVLSGLPTGQPLANFDFAFQPALERSRIETLATCQWIRENRTLLIQGPPGVGKTHLAIALGMRAVELGFGVVFYRLEDLLAALKRDADLPTSKLRSKKYLATSLVIIDEVGFEPMTRQEASLFFRLVSHRYQRGSILITTNKGIRDWPEVLAGDEVLATAILDRLLHKSHVLDIKGRRYRLRDLEQAVSRQGN